MTSALVKDGEVIAFYPGEVPYQIQLPGLIQVYCAEVGWVGSGVTEGYSILPVMMDEPPSPTAYPSSKPHTYNIVDGTVHVTRTWVTPEPPPLGVPRQITRKQGLTALLKDGGISDPEAAITSAISAIKDPAEQKIMRWSFDANDWLVSDLITYAPMLGMTEDQVKSLAIKAAAY